MSGKQGTYLGGIRTIEDLRQRCRVDDVTGCWHFGSASRTGKHAPGVRLAALNQEMVSLGVAIGTLVTGERPAKGVNWHTTCKTRHCANPKHRKAGTKKSQMRAAEYKPSAQTLARIAATRRKASVLSDQDIEAIRRSEETLQDLAKRYGVSASHISRIRLGQAWRSTAAPAASVFSWGGA